MPGPEDLLFYDRKLERTPPAAASANNSRPSSISKSDESSIIGPRKSPYPANVLGGGNSKPKGILGTRFQAIDVARFAFHVVMFAIFVYLCVTMIIVWTKMNKLKVR